MTHPASEDKLDPQDPSRRAMQPPIPTHPSDPLEAGEADKVVGPDTPPQDPNAPPHVNTGIGSGPVYDEVGGAGLGMAPGQTDAEGEKPATSGDRDTRPVGK